MTFRMSAKVVSLALAACSLLAGGIAYAGYVDRPNVTVTATTMNGSMWGARHSSDATDSLDCYVSGFRNGNSEMGCRARSKGVYKVCTSYDPSLVQAAAALNDYSELFVWFNASGECLQLSVYNGSQRIPG